MEGMTAAPNVIRKRLQKRYGYKEREYKYLSRNNKKLMWLPKHNVIAKRLYQESLSKIKCIRKLKLSLQTRLKNNGL